MERILECVPNFSEGNDNGIIAEIANEIETVAGVKLLDIDSGKATNRTVMTFAGNPDAVCEAAFRTIKKAAELIDMRMQKGEHPRFGVTDVCPLIPVSGLTMDEIVVYAHKLSARIGSELGIPIYNYEFAASETKRQNLAACRAGEYEGLPEKMKNPEWKPDFGPTEFNEQVAKTGAIALSARNFLVAYNVNLDTKSVKIAKAIAADIRESGRVVKDKNGNKKCILGILKNVKGIGWYLEDFDTVQLSYNLTNINVTSVHEVFEASCRCAKKYGTQVTGSELVGMIPLDEILSAGKYFLQKEKRYINYSQDEIVNFAVEKLGLNELKPFNPQEKIIEFALAT